jgi:hypothetical protein
MLSNNFSLEGLKDADQGLFVVRNVSGAINLPIPHTVHTSIDNKNIRGSDGEWKPNPAWWIIKQAIANVMMHPSV